MEKSKGKVKFFNTQKGFGFITPDGSDQKEIFVHITNISNGEPLNEGDSVEYIEGEGRKGPEATEVAAI